MTLRCINFICTSDSWPCSAWSLNVQSTLMVLAKRLVIKPWQVGSVLLQNASTTPRSNLTIFHISHRKLRRSARKTQDRLLHCLLKTMVMELLNLAITVYGPYATSVAVSHVTLQTHLRAASSEKGWATETSSCTVQRKCNRSIGKCVYKTGTRLSTTSGHGITMLSICYTIFIGCRYGIGLPSRWLVCCSALRFEQPSYLHETSRSPIFKFGSTSVELSTIRCSWLWSYNDV